MINTQTDITRSALVVFIFLLAVLPLSAQTAKDEAKLNERLKQYFAEIQGQGCQAPPTAPHGEL